MEVLSRSTRNYDLGDKARMYLRIPSLTDLLRVEQDKISIEHWRRHASGLLVESVQDLNATVKLDSLECEFEVAEAYTGVEFTS